jgi:hypothetical protein
MRAVLTIVWAAVILGPLPEDGAAAAGVEIPCSQELVDREH